jgi:microcin C transport system substrate-binding protein
MQVSINKVKVIISSLLLIIITLQSNANEINIVKKKHAISLYGEPKYQKNFTNFDYVNPDAVKGGVVKQGIVGSFDSLMPYIDRGVPAIGLGLTYDTLLSRSWDEPLTKYGLVAEYIEVDDNNFWVKFYINPKAKFNDNSPITADDVKFSFDILTTEGKTFYKNFYRDVAKVEIVNNNEVLFSFKNNTNKELALILGQMPILSKKYWSSRKFTATGFDIPVTSGPYKISEVMPGKSIKYVRNNDYWAKDLPVNKGRYNFNTMIYEYFLNANVLSEAVKKGVINFKVVDNPKEWHEYKTNDSLIHKGIQLTTIVNRNPQTVTLTFNQRRSSLQDIKVRQALSYAINFQWINKNLFYNIYQCAESIYDGTEFASRGIPEKNEKNLLTLWKNELPPTIFSVKWNNPIQLESIREKQKKSFDLLQSAGWSLKNYQLVNDNNKPLKLEFLTVNQQHEPVIGSIKKQLSKLGIELIIKTVEISQYIERQRNHDFDLILYSYPHTPSPGTEQANFWNSNWVDSVGSRNLSGVKLNVIDSLLKKIEVAKSRDQLLTTLKAIDRVLLHEYVVLPLWFLPDYLIVHNKSLKYINNSNTYNVDLNCWWYQQ